MSVLIWKAFLAAALAVLLYLPGFAQAGDLVNEGAGVSAGAFIANGIGARSRALGQSFVSIADDCNSIYWNPAGLAGIDNFQVDTMRSSVFMDDIYCNYLFFFASINSDQKL